MKNFTEKDLGKLQRKALSTDHQGLIEKQITIIGGSDLFHGAPLLSLKVASRIVDMVFFSSPEPSIGRIAERIKSQLFSFVWVPWSDVGEYIEKSDAALIGPGMKRWGSERLASKAKRNKVFDTAGEESRKIVKKFLKRYPQTRWVIDGGALQVMDPRWIPADSILTPNTKEYEMLFDNKSPDEAAKQYNCTILAKGHRAVVCSPQRCYQIASSNSSLTKGGIGDCIAGLTVALFAGNNSLLAAAAASLIVKKAAVELEKKVGSAYNADDLAQEIPKVAGRYLG